MGEQIHPLNTTAKLSQQLLVLKEEAGLIGLNQDLRRRWPGLATGLAGCEVSESLMSSPVSLSSSFSETKRGEGERAVGVVG